MARKIMKIGIIHIIDSKGADRSVFMTDEVKALLSLKRKARPMSWYFRVHLAPDKSQLAANAINQAVKSQTGNVIPFKKKSQTDS